MSTLSISDNGHSIDEKRQQDDMRRLFVGLVCVLLGVGIQMVHSASLSSYPGFADRVFLSRHLLFLGFAVLCGSIASFVPSEFLRRNAFRLFFLLLLLLAAVLVPGIGTRVNGAQRWLRFGSMSIQPSELGRLVLPLVAARMITDVRATTGFSMRTIPRTFLPVIVLLPLVAAEPDLGATVFLAMGFLLALFIGGWPMRYFVASASHQ